MTVIPAFHTAAPAYPPFFRRVYHDSDICRDAQRIRAEDRVQGTGGLEHCPRCEQTRTAVSQAWVEAVVVGR